MKDIVDGTNFYLSKSNFLYSKVNVYGSLNQIVKGYDLTQAIGIVTSDTLEDSHIRQHLENKRKRSSNILAGALVGGIIDSSFSDDSIVDGVLIGAAFGAIASKDSTNPKAQIGLIFKDGNTLCLEVDKEEYNRLNTVVTLNKEHSLEEDKNLLKKSLNERPLNEKECNKILKQRHNNKLFGSLFRSIFIVLLFFIPNIVASFYRKVEHQELSFKETYYLLYSEYVNHYIIDFMYYSIQPVIVCTVLFCLYSWNKSNNIKDLSIYLKDNESM